jgi:hypothetical protein
MAAPLTLIVFVAAGDLDGATTRAMAQATRDALGAEVRVDLRDARDAPADDGVAAPTLEEREHADAVVVLTWVDPARRQALIRVHVHGRAAAPAAGDAGSRWVERSIGFAPADADVERGRTLGFAVASILPDRGPAPAAASAPGAGAVNAEPREGSPPIDRKATLAEEGRAAEDAGARARTVGIDLRALGTVGVEGSSEDAGGVVAVEWMAMAPFAARWGVGVVGGNVPEAQASTIAVQATAGIAVHPLVARSRATSPVGFSVRAGYHLEHLSLTHTSEAGASARARWLSGVEAAADVRWALTQTGNVAAVAGVGIVDVFSSTYVSVRGVEVATLPPVRLFAEAGCQLRF